MKVNIHAGHAPYGIGGSHGAVGILNESNEARKVKNILIEKLKAAGDTVYDCSCDMAYNQQQVLGYIVSECNKNNVAYNISIHLNSGRNDYKGDNSSGGVEVYYIDRDMQELAELICKNISTSLNIRNRGAKINENLYVLASTKKAVLIECCFVDDKDDTDKWDAEKCAGAICFALKSKEITEAAQEQPRWRSDFHYRVHQESTGWGAVKQSGEVAGVTGKSKRIEALKIDWPGKDIYAKVHIQGIGWKDFEKITRDTIIGTVGEAKRLECLCFKGPFRWRVYLQKYGWTAWTKADGIATLGTVGQALRIEAIQFEEI